MIIKIIYNSNNQNQQKCVELTTKFLKKYSKLEVLTFDENHYKEKKKAFQIKASCGTKETPFIAVYNDDKEIVKAFYSEVDNNVFKSFFNYISKI